MRRWNLRMVAAVALLAGTCGAGERRLQRDTHLREGAGAYYPSLLKLERGTAVQTTGETQGAWLAARAGGRQGWLPEKAFEQRGGGIDYSSFIEKTDVTVVSSVDIAAATKGAFAASYSQRHDVNFQLAEKLAGLQVPAELVESIGRSLEDRRAEAVLGRMPPLVIDANIVLRPDAEELLGRALVARLVEPGFIADADVVAYVNSVAAVVGAKTERYDLSYRVGILDDPGINGFGLPGGYIMITKGLLARVRDEAELACLLGHEMTHISRYHGLREFRKRDVHRRRDSVFAELDEVTGGGSENEVEQDLNKLADTAYLTIIGGRAREDEMEADLFGLAYAAAAGYDPQGLIDVLSRIHGQGGAQDDMFRHHPSLAERIDALNRAMGRYRLRQSGQERMAARFQRYMSDSVGLRILRKDAGE